MVGLRSAARRPVGEYSKGMARRIGLAQALINDPDLLILDEPTSGLDPIGAKLVKDIIVRLGQVHKKTILLSSHLLADVEEVCDRMTILYGGRDRVTGRLEDVLSQRGRLQMTCDQLDPETVAKLRDLVETREGKTLEISAPRDRLETLFLRIVQEATAQRVETAGSAAAGDIAAFLGEQEEGQAVLESLTKAAVTDEAEPTPAIETPEAIAVDEAMLSNLTEAARSKPAPSAEKPAAEPAAPTAGPDVDRDVLDELSGDASTRDEA